MTTSNTTLAVIPVAIAAGAAFVLPEWLLFLATVALAKGLVVLGLLMMWRAGLVSFGQALYFAGGAYCAGLLTHYAGITDIFVLTFAAAVFGGGLAALAGLLLARYRGIFFAMLSLAFSMILYGALVNSAFLGSTDGIGIERITVFGQTPDEHFERTIFLFALLMSVVGAFAIYRYLRSPLGWLAEPIRDNEVRIEYLGVSVRAAIHIKLVLAGTLAGVGGALTAFAVGHVDPEMAYWTSSGGFVFITILAGTGSVFAPFLGAIVFELVRSFAFAYAPEFWQIILGGSLLAAIVFLPGGLWSLIQSKKGEGK